MIQTSKEPKLVPLFTSSIKAVCSNQDGALKYPKEDVPLTVRLIVGKDAFEVTDEHHTVRCDFSKGAIFWYKLEKHSEHLKDLGGRFLVLNDYCPCSVMEGKDLVLVLHVFSFTVLSEEEAKGHKSPSKGLKDLAKDGEISAQLEILKNIHLRHAIDKTQDLNQLPELEDILKGTKTAPCNTVISGLEDGKKKKASKKEEADEETIIAFKDIEAAEKSIAGDVEVLMKRDEADKEEILAGSEGDIKRRKLLEKTATKLKDPILAELLKNRGLLDRKRTPSKVSPKKRGKMPEDLKEAVKALVPEKKRSKAEGKKKAPAAEKKAAVEEDGKKVAKAKKSAKHGKTSKKK